MSSLTVYWSFQCLLTSGILINFKGSLTRDFWLQTFFMNQFPSGPYVSHWGYFKFLLKFAEIFESKGVGWKKTLRQEVLSYLLRCFWVAVQHSYNDFLHHVHFQLMSLQLFVITDINYRRCRCYCWLLIAGVIDTRDKLVAAGIMESGENPEQGLITGLKDTGDNLSPR